MLKFLRGHTDRAVVPYPPDRTHEQWEVTLELSERTYRCGHCGLVLGRDVNAAINLASRPDRVREPSKSPPLTAAA